jgi:hypothetical protein
MKNYNSLMIMKNISTPLKLRSLYRVVLSFLAILLLSANTACSSSEVMAKVEKPNLDDRPTGQITQLYKPLTSNKGGMNGYSDIDPRMDTSEADAKADRLIKQANARRDRM